MPVIAMPVSHSNWGQISLYGLFLQGKILLVQLYLLLMAQARHSNSVPKLLMMSEHASSHNGVDNSYEQKWAVKLLDT